LANRLLVTAMPKNMPDAEPLRVLVSVVVTIGGGIVPEVSSFLLQELSAATAARPAIQ